MVVLDFSSDKPTPRTVNVSDAARPAPPLVEEIVDVVLTYVPAFGAVTSTLAVQILFGATGIVPPVKLMDVAPVVGANVADPQLADRVMLGDVATCKPVGNASVNATPVSATVFSAGLVMVN